MQQKHKQKPNNNLIFTKKHLNKKIINNKKRKEIMYKILADFRIPVLCGVFRLSAFKGEVIQNVSG